MAFPVSWIVLYIILIPGSAIIGLITNTVFIIAVMARRKMTTTDILFVSLAGSDLIYDFFSLLGAIPRFIMCFDEDKGTDAIVTLLPVFYQCVYGLPNSVGKLLTVLLSIERTVAVFWPAYFRSHWRKRQALLSVIAGSTVVVITAVPMSLQMKTLPKEDMTNSTSPGSLETKFTDLFLNNRQLFILYNTLYQTLFGIIPILVVLVLNIATGFSLLRRKTKIGHLKGSRSERNTIHRHPGRVLMVSAAKKIGKQVEHVTTSEVESDITESGKSVSKSTIKRFVSQSAQDSELGRNASDNYNNIEDGNKSLKQKQSHSRAPVLAFLKVPQEEDDSDVSRGEPIDQPQCSKGLPTTSRRQTQQGEIGWSKKQKRLSVTLVMIASVFLFLNLPSKILVNVVFLTSDSTYSNDASPQLEIYIGVVLFCELLNTVINSSIFVIRSDKYRTYVHEKLQCCSREDRTIVV